MITPQVGWERSLKQVVCYRTDYETGIWFGREETEVKAGKFCSSLGILVVGD